MKIWTSLANRTSLRQLVQLYLAAFLAVFLGYAGTAHAARIKEVASIEGVRSNQLTGFGLVVGLDATGDQTMPYTNQGLSNYMQQMGLTLSAASLAQLQMKNVAAVLVTAQLSAMAQGWGYVIAAFGPLLVGLLRGWTGGFESAAALLVVSVAGLLVLVGGVGARLTDPGRRTT